jgi:hypothetical protein
MRVPIRYTSPMRDTVSKGSGSAHSVERQMSGRSRFAALLRETEAYSDLNRRICGSIPKPARDEIGVARIIDGCLVIAAASPARATQARLAAADILEAARQCWPAEIKTTRVVVTPGVRFGE